MGRRPSKKAIEAEAEASSKGRLEAQRKFYKKYPLEAMKTSFQQFFSNTSMMDIVKITTIFSLSFIVKGMTKHFLEDATSEGYGILAGKPPRPFFAWLLKGVSTTLGIQPFLEDMAETEVYQWLLALAVSYMIVEHWGTMFQGATSMAGAVKMFFGL